MPRIYPHGFSRYRRDERDQAIDAGHAVVRAEEVVREGAGVEKGKAIVVSGRLYRWLDPTDAVCVDTLDVQRQCAPGGF